MYRPGQTVIVPSAEPGTGTGTTFEFHVIAARRPRPGEEQSWFRGLIGTATDPTELFLPWHLTLAHKARVPMTGHLGPDLHAATVTPAAVRPYVLAVQGASRYQGPFNGYFTARQRP